MCQPSVAVTEGDTLLCLQSAKEVAAQSSRVLLDAITLSHAAVIDARGRTAQAV